MIDQIINVIKIGLIEKDTAEIILTIYNSKRKVGLTERIVIGVEKDILEHIKEIVILGYKNLQYFKINHSPETLIKHIENGKDWIEDKIDDLIDKGEKGSSVCINLVENLPSKPKTIFYKALTWVMERL